MKVRGFNVEIYCLRDSVHRVNDFGVQAERKRGLREQFIMLKGQIT